MITFDVEAGKCGRCTKKYVVYKILGLCRVCYTQVKRDKLKMASRRACFLLSADECEASSRAVGREDPRQPTKHRPGTPGKIEVMRRRAEMNLPVFNEGDAGRGGEPMNVRGY